MQFGDVCIFTHNVYMHLTLWGAMTDSKHSTEKISQRTLTLILAGGKGERLYPLTRDRAKPAVPFGGVCRIIDFTLSNCLNSKLDKICVLTQYQYESVHSHIRNAWLGCQTNADRFLQCLQPMKGKRYSGTADAVYQNRDLLQRMNPDLILILSADHIYRMDYRELLRFHIDQHADVTISTVECPNWMSQQLGVVETGENGRITGFEEKPDNPRSIPGNPSKVLANMGIYVFNTDTLFQAVTHDAQIRSRHDFGRNVLPGLIRSQKVFAYRFNGDYWRDVGTVDAYYEANMDLLVEDPQVKPDHSCRPACGLGSLVSAATRSIIPDSAAVPVGSVFHSVLSPGVRVERGAAVRDSILMTGVHIGSGARVRRAIIEEHVRIADGARIGYNTDEDSRRFLLSDDGVVVVRAYPLETGKPERIELHSDLKQLMSSLFLSNIPHDCTEQELKTWVESLGFEISGLRIIRDLVAGVSPGFAYVSIKEPSKLADAVRNLDGQTLGGRIISVSEHRRSLCQTRTV
jgi:glucose-1-phosphate adenylyltransferase